VRKIPRRNTKRKRLQCAAKRDRSEFEYKRNRGYDPKTGRFTQEDPIGLAGGLNLYGFANGDPVNFSDPFGLCPVCAVYAVFEVGPSLYDAYDLAKTAIGYARGKVSKVELGITAAGAGAGIFGFGGGYGKLGREAASRLIRDVSDNPSSWKVVGTFTEVATNKKAKGGVSIQTIVENEAGDRLVRHTVVDKSGKVIDDHYRPMFKPRDVDRQ
jgi:RHS repeat-associated protein